MAKVYGMGGLATGKKGNEVYAIRSGENIVRQYQPRVSNPNTSAQVASRAKLKLMSQLAAAISPVIAIKAKGLQSSRNLFIKLNYGFVQYDAETASINLNQIQLTKSNISFPDFIVSREDNLHCNIQLSEGAAEDFDKVCYIIYVKQPDQTLRLLDSKLISEAGEQGVFPAVMKYSASAIVVYAYGIRLNSERVKARFGQMVAPSAIDIAQLLVKSSEVMGDVTLSETRGLTMNVGETLDSSDNVIRATIAVAKSGDGTVAGGGRYEVGTQVTVVATPNNGATFLGWHENSKTGALVSNNASYSFTAEENRTLVAVFQGGNIPTYTIAAATDPAGHGTITGAGTYEEGDEVTLNINTASGWDFKGWYEGETLVSSNRAYSFTVNQSRSLTAKVEEHQGDEND